MLNGSFVIDHHSLHPGPEEWVGLSAIRYVRSNTQQDKLESCSSLFKHEKKSIICSNGNTDHSVHSDLCTLGMPFH